MSVGDNPTEANVRPILPLPSARFPPEMKKISLYRVETVGGKEQLVQEPWRGGQKLYQTRMPNALVTTEFPDMPEFNAVTVKNLRNFNFTEEALKGGRLVPADTFEKTNHDGGIYLQDEQGTRLLYQSISCRDPMGNYGADTPEQELYFFIAKNQDLPFFHLYFAPNNPAKHEDVKKIAEKNGQLGASPKVLDRVGRDQNQVSKAQGDESFGKGKDRAKVPMETVVWQLGEILQTNPLLPVLEQLGTYSGLPTDGLLSKLPDNLYKQHEEKPTFPRKVMLDSISRVALQLYKFTQGAAVKPLGADEPLVQCQPPPFKVMSDTQNEMFTELALKPSKPCAASLRDQIAKQRQKNIESGSLDLIMKKRPTSAGQPFWQDPEKNEPEMKISEISDDTVIPMENRREVTYQILRELVSREAGFTPSSSKRSDEQSTRKPEPGSMGSGGLAPSHPLHSKNIRFFAQLEDIEERDDAKVHKYSMYDGGEVKLPPGKMSTNPIHPPLPNGSNFPSLHPRVATLSEVEALRIRVLAAENEVLLREQICRLCFEPLDFKDARFIARHYDQHRNETLPLCPFCGSDWSGLDKKARAAHLLNKDLTELRDLMYSARPSAGMRKAVAKGQKYSRSAAGKDWAAGAKFAGVPEQKARWTGNLNAKEKLMAAERQGAGIDPKGWPQETRDAYKERVKSERLQSGFMAGKAVTEGRQGETSNQVVHGGSTNAFGKRLPPDSAPTTANVQLSDNKEDDVSLASPTPKRPKVNFANVDEKPDADMGNTTQKATETAAAESTKEAKGAKATKPKKATKAAKQKKAKAAPKKPAAAKKVVKKTATPAKKVTPSKFVQRPTHQRLTRAAAAAAADADAEQ